MSQKEKLLLKILSGTKDASITKKAFGTNRRL